MMSVPRVLCVLSALICWAQALEATPQDIIIEARLFRGSRQVEAAGTHVAVSSFADPLMVSSDPAQIRAEHGNIAAMRAELFDIYHLQTVNHITTSRFIWNGTRANLGGTIFLDDHNYPMEFFPTVLSPQALKLRVEMSRFKIRESSESGQELLNTEINMNFDQPVVLGFPLNGHSYFLSLNVTRRAAEAGPDRVVPGYLSGTGYIAPPLPLQEVTPVFPASLKTRRLEGVVFLNISLDPRGRVNKVSTLIATHPEFERAAHAALEQWRYEPVLKEGRAIPAVFAVAVEFRLQEGQNDGSVSASPDDTNPELERILDRCAEYCDRLSSSVLDFVCLEEIEEKINSTRSGVSYRRYVSRPDGSLRSYSGMNPVRTEKNTFVYDYQLIRKSGDVREIRTLIEENGEETHEENAPLKTKAFWYRHVVLGPTGLLCRAAQEWHDYELLKDGKISGDRTYVIKAVPKAGAEAEHLYGKIWVRKRDFAILKIEWEQESLGNFQAAQQIAQEMGARPEIRLVSEYAFDKNGIRFPSRYSVVELYIHKRTGRRFLRSETNVEYRDYKFFTVDTDVKYK